MIKLPVRLCEAFRPSENSFLLDADDKFVSYDTIAAALNAAPKRAFEGMTIRELCTMMEGDEVSEEELLARLQAFAAPQVPQWQPITFDAVVRLGRVVLLPKDRARDCVIAEIAEDPEEGFSWDGDYSFEEFTHFMPLPAAPEAQGGENG